jgi:hypothetical protein
MDGRHWTEDEFLNRLYEAGGGDESHLASCAQCAARWGEVRASRAALLSDEPEVPHEVLAAQRRAIYRRLESGPERRMPWVPAVATAAMVVVGLFLFRAGQEPAMEPLVSPGDDKVFAEVYAMEQSAEPAAAEKLKGLFEEEPQ